nr:Gfo/Idh/MocA family oxidoreductase [Clostridia bacterium]
MSKKIYKVGIVGCGGIANGKHMPALKKLENVQMVAFCDIIRERAEKAAAEFGSEDALIFTDYRELVALPELD